MKTINITIKLTPDMLNGNSFFSISNYISLFTIKQCLTKYKEGNKKW